MTLEQQFRNQQLANAYELIDGVAMHAQNGDSFQIPHPVLKKHVAVGHFVELRIDSPRFSTHDDVAEKCYCPSCHGEATKPILRHLHPESFVPLPQPPMVARGWGEDFWVQVIEREGDWFSGKVDNCLQEARLHDLRKGDTVFFHVDHLLAIHDSHRADLVAMMTVADLKTLAQWLAQCRGPR